MPFVLVQSSPEIRAWMSQNGVKSISELEQYFEARVLALARAAGRSYIVWQASPCAPPWTPFPTIALFLGLLQNQSAACQSISRDKTYLAESLK